MNRIWLRRFLFFLVGVLIFEGVLRKVLPVRFSNYFLLFKDALVLPIAILVLRSRLTGQQRSILGVYLVFAAAFLPLVLYTMLKDPILAAYGAKQYLLYAFVGLAVPIAFGRFDRGDFTALYKFLALSLFLTTGAAMIQLRLPASHWLNQSVTGADLSGFSAGGKLRISATFPFVAQYCWYLMALSYAIVIGYVWRRRRGIQSWMFSLIVLLPFFVVSTFATGSRTSVLGNGAIVVLSGLLILLRGRRASITRLAVFVVAVFVSLNLMQIAFEDAFVAYEARSRDTDLRTHRDEITDRFENAAFHWFRLYSQRDIGFLGYGIGTMSNGVQNFSSYAAEIRSGGVWGETDLANTVLEGGLYLVVIWMAFRVFVIMICLRLFIGLQSPRCIYSCAFAVAFVVINGVMGTLGIQPPLAIWWWLAVGAVLLFAGYESFHLQSRSQRMEGIRTPRRNS